MCLEQRERHKKASGGQRIPRSRRDDSCSIPWIAREQAWLVPASSPLPSSSFPLFFSHPLLGRLFSFFRFFIFISSSLFSSSSLFLSCLSFFLPSLLSSRFISISTNPLHAHKPTLRLLASCSTTTTTTTTTTPLPLQPPPFLLPPATVIIVRSLSCVPVEIQIASFPPLTSQLARPRSLSDLVLLV